MTPYKHVLTCTFVGKMHSVVTEMKSVQQYFLHYGPILFFSMSQKETETVLSFANVRVDIHFTLQETIFHQRTIS